MARTGNKGTTVAKPRVTPSRPAPGGRPGATVLAGDRNGNYFKEVFDELRKVQWPSGSELWRMTGIVIGTVILLTAIIGGADEILQYIVPQPK